MRYLHDPGLQVLWDLGLFAATVLLAVLQGWRYFFPWDLVRDARKARAAASPRFIPSTRFQ